MVLWRLMTAKTPQNGSQLGRQNLRFMGFNLAPILGKVLATLRRHRTFLGALCWTPNSNPPNTATSNLSKEFVDFLTKSACGRLQGGP